MKTCEKLGNVFFGLDVVYGLPYMESMDFNVEMEFVNRLESSSNYLPDSHQLLQCQLAVSCHPSLS